LPSNADAVRLFLACDTQWRTSFSGVTGLDYNVLFSLFSLYSIEDKRSVLDDIKVMESRALQLFHKGG